MQDEPHARRDRDVARLARWTRTAGVSAAVATVGLAGGIAATTQLASHTASAGATTASTATTTTTASTASTLAAPSQAPVASAAPAAAVSGGS
jgi:hypothetical protein